MKLALAVGVLLCALVQGASRSGGIILGRDGAFFERGREWIPVARIDANSADHLETHSTKSKLSDADINSLRGSYHASMFWLQCGPCNAYVQQDLQWAASRKTGSSKIEYCSLSPDGPFRKSGLDREGAASDIHHGVDCFGIQTVYGRSIHNSKAVMREAYQESVEVNGVPVPQPGCYCNGAGHSGVLYVSVPHKLGVAGATSRLDGRVWIPVVNIPATTTEHVHVVGSPRDKLSDTVINSLRGNLATSLLWLQCGPCNVYIKQAHAFVANGDRFNDNELTHCGDSSAGPFQWKKSQQSSRHISRGISCGTSSGLVDYQRGSQPGCFCDGEAWRPGTLYVSSGVTKPPTPAPTAKSSAGLGAKYAIEVGGMMWAPVAKIFKTNIDHIITSQTDYKLSDDEINQLRGDYHTSTIWLRCGQCDTYVREDQAWVSDGYTSANGLVQNCSLYANGPFKPSSNPAKHTHRGLDCARQSTVYQIDSQPGCSCSGLPSDGMLYVHYSKPQRTTTTTAPASTSTAPPVARPRVDCEVDEWTEYSVCTETCGGGIRQRFRSIRVKPQNGGAACPPLDQASECNKQSCPTVCHYTWARWGPCSRMCGGGVQSRRGALVYETSSIRACRPRAQQDRVCNPHDCPTPAPTLAPTPAPTRVPTPAPTPKPVDCVVSQWSTWPACPTTCGGATVRRVRKVKVAAQFGGRPCGALVHARMCASVLCPVPVNCKLSKWSSWQVCSHSCNGGRQTRSRTVEVQPRSGGTPCLDNLDEARACNLQSCPTMKPTPAPTPGPVDCVLSLWSTWSTCSKLCAGGVQKRTRSETVPASHGGKPCGMLESVRNCNMQACPKDCHVGQWGAYGSCDLSCSLPSNSGRRTRTRHILVAPERGGKVCPFLIQTQTGCAEGLDCKLDCLVSEWSIPGQYEWWRKGLCSKSCGGGTYTRIRHVVRFAAHGGKKCPATSQTHACNVHPCPISCEMSAWSKWSACSATCGHETHSRWRTVKNGHVSHGGRRCPAQSQTRDCPQRPPCVVDCVMSKWSTWTQCSSSCDGGTRSRKRKMLTKPVHGGKRCPHENEFQTCNTFACPVDCKLGAAVQCGTCSSSCGAGTQKCKHRVLAVALYGGKPCPQGAATGAWASELRKCSHQNPCPVDCKLTTEWKRGKCSATCGSGKRVDTKEIKIAPKHGGALCPPLTRIMPCNTEPCPIDCQLSPWDEWSTCTKSCGTGTTKRTRYVIRHPGLGGKVCGHVSEERKCNRHSCLHPVCHVQHVRCFIDYTKQKQLVITHDKLHAHLGGNFHCHRTGAGQFNRMFETCECRCNKHLPCCARENYVLTNAGLAGNTYKGVKSKAECCSKCTFHPLCDAWEYSAKGVCILKTGTPVFVANPEPELLTTWAGSRAGHECVSNAQLDSPKKHPLSWVNEDKSPRYLAFSKDVLPGKLSRHLGWRTLGDHVSPGHISTYKGFDPKVHASIIGFDPNKLAPEANV